MSSGDKVLHIG